MFFRFLLFSLLVAFISGTASSQQISTPVKNINDRFYAVDSLTAIDIYNNTFYNKLGYAIGKEYKVQYIPGRSSPYFYQKSGQGTVYSKGYDYGDLILIYDVKSDKVVAVPREFGLSDQYLELKKAAVDSFDIAFEDIEYRFHHIRFDIEQQSIAQDGFYEMPYKGTFTLLLKHHTYSKVEQTREEFSFFSNYLLLKEGVVYKLDRRNKFLKLFPEYKKPLKNKLRTFGVYYSDLSRIQMASLIEYTDELINKVNSNE